MVAMRKSEYETTDKFDLTINGWGGEDVKFFEACVNAKVRLPVLTHHFRL